MIRQVNLHSPYPRGMYKTVGINSVLLQTRYNLRKVILINCVIGQHTICIMYKLLYFSPPRCKKAASKPLYCTLNFDDFTCALYPPGLLCDLLWSDPDKDTNGWGENDRGVSFTFGADVVSKFLNRHDLDLICRAHQVST